VGPLSTSHSVRIWGRNEKTRQRRYYPAGGGQSGRRSSDPAALQKARIANKLVIARDGPEALDFLFGTGAHARHDTSTTPEVVLLDLKLPKLDGLEVLRRLEGRPAHQAAARGDSDLIQRRQGFD